MSARSSPLLRLELHPHDADYPEVRDCWSAILLQELQSREPLTLGQATRLLWPALQAQACSLPRQAGQIPARHGAKCMNKDQVKGAAKEVAGKVQRKAGELVDSPKHQVKGATKEVAGKAQKGMGNLKEDMRDSKSRA